MLKETAATLNDQAVRLVHDGDYEDALLCFSRAIEIESGNALLWYNLGLTYRDNDELEKAVEALEKAHSIDETDEDTIRTLAVLCISLGSYEAAKEWCAEGIALDEANADLWNTLGVAFFNEMDYPTASSCFERAVEINPYFFEALGNLRDTYSEMGNKAGEEECQRHLDRAQKHSKGQAGVWH